MAEFIFDFPEQAKALYDCGYSFEEAVEMIQRYPLPDEIMSCIKKCYGPFTEGSAITLFPYDEGHGGIFFTEEDFKDDDIYRHFPTL